MSNPAAETHLRTLNEQYVQAFLDADVDWYRKHLAEEFLCIESDGSLLDKAQFLANTAQGPDVAGYELEQVDVRFYGATALVQATGRFTRADGSQGRSRYIDVYVEGPEGWKTVSAQITRSLLPAQA